MLVYVDLYCTKRHHSGLKCIKIAGGWGSAPDPAGGAYSAPPRPPSWFRGGEGWGGVGREGVKRGGVRGGEGEGKEGREKRGGDKRASRHYFFYTLSTDWKSRDKLSSRM